MTDLSSNGKGTNTWKKYERRGNKGKIKRIKICYVPVSTPQNKCNDYVLQTGTNKNL